MSPDEVAFSAAEPGWEALARAVQAGQGQIPARWDDADSVLPMVRAVQPEDIPIGLPPSVEFLEHAVAVFGPTTNSL
jgi:hypothetical protein